MSIVTVENGRRSSALSTITKGFCSPSKYERSSHSISVPSRITPPVVAVSISSARFMAEKSLKAFTRRL